jgi:hypothetical protein
MVTQNTIDGHAINGSLNKIKNATTNGWQAVDKILLKKGGFGIIII